MRSVILAIAGLLCSVAWLVLLVATNFSLLAVSAGLLVALYAMSSSSTPRPNAIRSPRAR